MSSMMEEMPPELMGALQGGAPEMGAPPVEAEEELSSVEHLQAAIEHAEDAMVGEPYEADSAQLAKIVHQLYALLAKQQDDGTKAQGGDPGQVRTLRRAYGG